MSELIDALKKFLAEPGSPPPPARRRPYVTLTRQEGLFSHEVGRAIISRLDALPDRGWNRGWELMDQQLCAWMIRSGSVPASFDAMVAEHYGEEGLQQMVYEMLVGSPEEHLVRARVSEVMRFLLRLGRVVIVGSGAAVEATAFESPGVSVRIVSSEARRLAFIEQQERCTRDVARRRMRTEDAQRARLLREHYRRDIDDPVLYDATFLADRLTAPQIARAVVSLLEVRMEPFAAEFRPPLSATAIV